MQFFFPILLPNLWNSSSAVNLSNASTFGEKRVAGTYSFFAFSDSYRQTSCIPSPRPRDIFILVQCARVTKESPTVQLINVVSRTKGKTRRFEPERRGDYS